MTDMTVEKSVPRDAEFCDRREQFVRYGFELDVAEVLADAKDGLWPLHHLKVKRALDAGATHAQALEIFA